MRKGARDGDLTVRAACATAYQVRLYRLAAGHDEEESEEAESGALIAAEDASDVTQIRHIAKAWIDSHKK